ncbi:MAG: arginyl-tRNA--protein-N-Asp/Glu arginylyltransferase [Gammaproteobacteria bacterium]|jgi:arginyl-tRNA--protein-N-Asp/Glu arginylyltransferase
MNDQVKLNFFASTPEPCGYLENRKAISAFANPHIDMNMDIYDDLIQHGFRRSGSHVYRPHCPSCQECISVRVLVKKYNYSRNEKRYFRLNRDLEVKTVGSRFKAEHFDLYRRYVNARHSEGSMANPTKADYHRFLISEWTETIFLEFRLNKVLIAVAVTDVLNSSLSPVYTFFDPDYNSRSLGHYAILKQIEEAQSREHDYVYLGYWIKDCQKMSYKRRYRPMEAFIHDQWVTL